MDRAANDVAAVQQINRAKARSKVVGRAGVGPSAGQGYGAARVAGSSGADESATQIQRTCRHIESAGVSPCTRHVQRPGAGNSKRPPRDRRIGESGRSARYVQRTAGHAVGADAAGASIQNQRASRHGQRAGTRRVKRGKGGCTGDAAIVGHCFSSGDRHCCNVAAIRNRAAGPVGGR